MGRKKKEIPATYGGQAVMEGVMMRGKKHYCTAVRSPSGVIETRFGVQSSSKFVTVSEKIPIFRGIVKLGSSMVMGLKVMQSSAQMAGLEEEVENPSKFDMWLEKKFGDKLTNYIIIFAVVLSLAFSVGLFMVLPTWLSSLLPVENARFLGVVEGLVRLAIFIGYLLLISRMKDIKRVFEYHGAEHMVINCYEAGEALTPGNAKNHSRLHKRCGTSFLLFVMLISMVFFLFVNTDVVWLRVASRILFVPFIAGISFEVIRWAGISKSPIVKILSWPGFMMQRVTTAVPDNSQLEVAIAALNGVLWAESEEGKDVSFDELRKWGKAELSGDDDATTDADALLMLAAGINNFNDFLLKKHENTDINIRQKFRAYVGRRKNHEPLQYIAEGWTFMDATLSLSRDVLIPRSDTEVLVNAVLENEERGVLGLEIGVGSGAVSVELKNHGGHEMFGTDICPKAVKLANENFVRNHGAKSLPFVQGDLFENVPRQEKFDFIVSNPPYIATGELNQLPRSVKDYEPMLALDGGADGLDFYRRIAAEAGAYLKDGGGLYFEIGETQANDVTEIMINAGFSGINTIKDLNERDRVVYGRR